MSSGHNITPKKSTNVYTNCESGLATINSYSKACCTQAGPAHTAVGGGMDR